MKTKPLTFLLALTFLFLFSGCEEQGVKYESYPNWESMSETHYKNGKKDGLETWWYEPGEHTYEKAQLKWKETHYKNGKKEGLETFWFHPGIKQKWRGQHPDHVGTHYIETHYKNGKKDGLETEWYESGKKRLELLWKNGKQEGRATYWEYNGKKGMESHYKNGIENGIRKEWNINGNLTFEGNFVDGVLETASLKRGNKITNEN